MQLTKGKTYFEITYADADRTMPGVRPMVYVGCNIFPDEAELTHCFQDTVSVMRHGLLGDGDDVVVFSFTEDELGKALVDISELSQLMLQAYERFVSCGEPKLEKIADQQ